MLKKFIAAYETLTQANLALGHFLGPALNVCAFNYILQLNKLPMFVDTSS